MSNDLDSLRTLVARATGTGWEAAYRQDVAALVAEVERLRADLDFLARAVVQALIASSLAAGETLADPIPHIIVSTVTRLRAEALGQRAVNAEIGALAYAYGAEAERAAAVAYLRYHAEVFVADERALCRAANDIERGDHVTEVKS